MAKWSWKNLFKKDEEVVEQQQQAAEVIQPKIDPVHVEVTTSRVGDGAYKENHEIRDFKSETVTSIGAQSFASSTVNNVTAPNVVTIKEEGFANSDVRYVQVADGVSVGQSGFENSTIREMKNLGNVDKQGFANSDIVYATFSDKAESIGYAAFRDCRSLQEVELNEGLKSIGPQAFKGCNSLEEIIIPKSVETVGAKAFEDCGHATIRTSNAEIAEQLNNEYKHGIRVIYDKPVELDHNVRNLSDFVNQKDWKESLHMYREPEGNVVITHIPESLTKINIDLPYKIELDAIQNSNLKEVTFSFDNPQGPELYRKLPYMNIKVDAVLADEFQQKVEAAKTVENVQEAKIEKEKHDLAF